MTEMIERVAKAIAEQLYDDFDHAFASKSEWAELRGEKGGRFRDINEPMQGDYLDAARAAIEAMREPTHNMVGVGSLMCDEKTPEQDQARARGVWWGMLDAALKGS